MHTHPSETRRAIVLGGGIAGLLAAQAVAPHFDRVIVVERDIVERDLAPSAASPREGVPQGKHIHVLLPGGIQAIDRLFPGASAALIEHGAQPFDYGQSEFYIVGKWMPRIVTGLNTLAQTRPFLEHSLRRMLATNVEMCNGARATSLLWDQMRSRVCGVRFADTELHANLVIDATGRNSRLARWLVDADYPQVAESVVGIDLGYATGIFRVPPHLHPNHPMLYVVGPAPRSRRVGVRVLVEGGLVYGGMGGYHGDHPPIDLKGFLDFARSLSQPNVFNVLSHSELLAPIKTYRIPSSNRRHYSQMRRFPQGLLPIGDSICNLDPAFAHGMTVAAQEAVALRDCLADRPSLGATFQRDYFRRVDAIVDVPWDLCRGENFKYPQTTGRRPPLFPITSAYKDRVATCDDVDVVRDFYRVIALTAPPHLLLHPRILTRL